jgi:hypothetical protein
MAVAREVHRRPLRHVTLPLGSLRSPEEPLELEPFHTKGGYVRPSTATQLLGQPLAVHRLPLEGFLGSAPEAPREEGIHLGTLRMTGAGAAHPDQRARPHSEAEPLATGPELRHRLGLESAPVDRGVNGWIRNGIRMSPELGRSLSRIGEQGDVTGAFALDAERFGRPFSEQLAKQAMHQIARVQVPDRQPPPMRQVMEAPRIDEQSEHG